MKHSHHLLLFAYFLTLAALANAQSTTSTSEPTNDRFYKSIYMDLGKTFVFNSGAIGLTFITPNNWLISSSYRKGEIVAPQKPSDYRPASTGGGGGGGIIGPIVNLNGIPSSGENSGPQKKYKYIIILTTGKLFESSKIDTRFRLDSGIVFFDIDEAVDFVAVGNGYTYSKEQLKKIGAHVKLGLEFPTARRLGFGTSLEGTFAKGERLFSIGVSLLLGVLY